MKYIFAPFSGHDTENLFLSRAFDPKDCIYEGLPEDPDNTIKDRFSRRSFQYKLKNNMSQIRLCFRLRKHFKNDNVFILWCFQKCTFFIGLYARLFRKSQKIFCINFLDHTEDGRKLKVKKILLHYIFSNPGFYLSVNCEEERKKVESRYGIPHSHTFVLTDCVAWDYPEKDFSDGDGTVFCGGNLRDWPVYFDAARLLPDLRFVAVGGSNLLTPEILQSCPDNVDVYLDVPLEQFYRLLADCTISVIAVPTAAPNGLTVVYNSAFLNRAVIAADTPSLRKLLYHEESHSYGGITYELGNSEDLARRISELHPDSPRRRLLCEIMTAVLNDHTAEAYSGDLSDFIHSL